MASPAELRVLYVQKSSDFATTPLAPILETLDSGRPLDFVVLDGKSKALFKDRVKSMQVYALCETLYEYDALSVLRLPYNFLNDMAAQAISRLIQVNKSLKMLDLTGNEVAAAGVEALAGVLSQPDCCLQALVLRNNPLKDAGALAVAEMLRQNKSLTMLDLADTHFSIQGLIGLANALTDGNSSLKILDLEDAQLQAPQDSTYQHVSRMLASNSSITELSLAKHRMVDSQLEMLVSQGFARSRANWVSLSFRANRLSPLAGPMLERLLGLVPRLQRLNLSANSLGNDGAIALARCLPSCAALQELDVRSNAIGDPGIIALAGALQRVHTLEIFTLWGNNFGPGACRAMAEALASPVLRRLRTDVRPYEVDGESALALQEA